MKGKCDLIKCQICDQEMSFGRIKRHISSQHKETTVDQYIKKYWSTLPLHKPCEVCKENIVYKYKTCSKDCQSKLQHGLKGKPKPEGFGVGKTFKCKKQDIKRPNAGGKGISRNKGKQPMLGKSQSEHQKLIVKNRFLEYYAEGNDPWTKTHSHTTKTIEKIFAKRPMNKLEKFVSSILDENNIEYHFQYFLKTKDGTCKSYDFKIKDTNILVEIDGDYWHGGPGVNKHFYKLEEVKENDILKNQIATENGFSLIRIWESNIYNQPDIIIQKIQEIK